MKWGADRLVPSPGDVLRHQLKVEEPGGVQSPGQSLVWDYESCDSSWKERQELVFGCAAVCCLRRAAELNLLFCPPLHQATALPCVNASSRCPSGAGTMLWWE